MNHIKLTRRTLSIALILGIAWDILFYGKPLGISVPLFVFLSVGALVYTGRQEGARPAWRNLWLLLPLFFVASMVLLRANAFLTFLNIVAIMALLGLLAHFYAAGWLERTGLVGYPLILLRVAGNTLVRPVPLLRSSVNWTAARQRGGRGLLPVVRGCLLAVPVLLVFSCILASADLIFAKYVEDLLHIKYLADVLDWLWRGILILLVAWIAAGGLLYATSRHGALDDQSSVEKALDGLSRSISLGFVEVTILLTSVNLLFLAFVVIQFVYLFGGQVNINIEGYTYAEYARRGFFELLTVSLLTLGLILALHRIGRRELAGQRYAFNALSSLLVGLVLVILASAFQRLRLYEAAFGYTQLRLYSHVFMAWLGFTFIWFLISLWLRPDRFALGALLAALGFLITLNLINPDAFIARQNLARFQAIGKLDAHYLTRLSDDALPLLVRNMDQIGVDERQTLSGHLRSRLKRMRDNSVWRKWPAFHISRWRAYNMLLEHYQD